MANTVQVVNSNIRIYKPHGDLFNPTGLTMMQVLRDIKAGKLLLVDNPTIDPIINDVGKAKELIKNNVLPGWFDPLVAFPPYNEKIGESITYNYPAGAGKIGKIVLDGVSDFKGRKKIALAIPTVDENRTPTFEIEVDSELISVINIVNKSAIHPIENFPQFRDGHHLTDARFGLPIGGGEFFDDHNARCLFRFELPYVGFVGRDATVPHIITLFYVPTNQFGVLAFNES